MMKKISPAAATVTASVAALAQGAPADAADLNDFLRRVRSHDLAVRGPAWQEAARYGAPAIRPLADAVTDGDFEVGRAARRALWLIVRHAGRPGAETERQAVEEALLALLAHPAIIVQREALWMLSEIGSNRVVQPVAALLRDPDTREDARCALLRLPGPGRREALRAAFATAPESFKYALADSLRLLGETVPGYPSRKLVPTHQTQVGTGE